MNGVLLFYDRRVFFNSNFVIARVRHLSLDSTHSTKRCPCQTVKDSKARNRFCKLFGCCIKYEMQESNTVEDRQQTITNTDEPKKKIDNTQLCFEGINRIIRITIIHLHKLES
jgi:hypothetical protein